MLLLDEWNTRLQQAQIEAIVFDLDNTLIDRDSAFKACTAALWKAYQSLPLSHNIWEEIIDKDHRGYTPRTIFYPWLQMRFFPLLSSLEIEQFYQTHLSTYLPPSEQALLSWLQALKEKYTLAILSNGGSQNQRAKLANSQLDQRFDPDQIFISGELSYRKPQLAIFTHVAELMGVQPSQLIMVGDHPTNDIKGAEAAGWLTFSTDYPQLITALKQHTYV
ncbi:MAG: HAD family hydrolase [Thermonemataceae bacterium]|mgnify:CR=1 FL=1